MASFSNKRAQNGGGGESFLYLTAVPSKTRDFRNGIFIKKLQILWHKPRGGVLGISSCDPSNFGDHGVGYGQRTPPYSTVNTFWQLWFQNMTFLFFILILILRMTTILFSVYNSGRKHSKTAYLDHRPEF